MPRSTPSKTPERRLAERAAVQLSRRERRTAGNLLLLEASALDRLRRPIHASSSVLESAVRRGADPLFYVRHEQATLDHALEAEFIAARARAADEGAALLARELEVEH